MVVAQLVEQLLPTQEVRGSNPVKSKINIEQCLLSTALKRQKKKNEAESGPFKKLILLLY